MTEVIRVVKHVHISGRWPTSRQHRFGRYVQGAMPKVVGRQRIKRARSAREDSSIYGGKLGSPPGVPGSKTGIFAKFECGLCFY